MTMNDRGQIVLTAYPTPNASDRTAPQSNYCTGELPFAPTSLKQEKLLANNTPSDRSQDIQLVIST
jgi:hypothetical protein